MPGCEAWDDEPIPTAGHDAEAEGGAFVTVEYPDGTTWVDHTRLVNGWVMCCLCFEYKPRSELAPHPELDGCVIDVCKPCAVADAEAVARRANEEPDHA